MDIYIDMLYIYCVQIILVIIFESRKFITQSRENITKSREIIMRCGKIITRSRGYSILPVALMCIRNIYSLMY